MDYYIRMLWNSQIYNITDYHKLHIDGAFQLLYYGHNTQIRGNTYGKQNI